MLRKRFVIAVSRTKVNPNTICFDPQFLPSEADIPVRHDLHQFLESYVTGAEIDRADKDAPLFRASNWRRGALTDRPMNRVTVWRMVKRRFAQADLDPSVLKTHSFRAAVATDLLNQGVSLEDVQDLLLHKDPRTTRLYFRGKQEIKRNIVERISH